MEGVGAVEGARREAGNPEETIRPMVAGDVDEVLEIEGRQFTSPWQADTFLGLLGRPGAELWVTEAPDGGIAAYAVLWCILDQGELANIAVRPEYAGQGYARRLLARLLDLARESGVKTVYLEVRRSNHRAAELYRRFGFEEAGTRRNYYDQPREDALVMRLVL